MQKTVEMMFKNFQIVYISSKNGQLLMELPNKDIGIEFLYIENGIFKTKNNNFFTHFLQLFSLNIKKKVALTSLPLKSSNYH